jgi:hypothetical protein
VIDRSDRRERVGEESRERERERERGSIAILVPGMRGQSTRAAGSRRALPAAQEGSAHRESSQRLRRGEATLGH